MSWTDRSERGGWGWGVGVGEGQEGGVGPPPPRFRRGCRREIDEGCNHRRGDAMPLLQKIADIAARRHVAVERTIDAAECAVALHVHQLVAFERSAKPKLRE